METMSCRTVASSDVIVLSCAGKCPCCVVGPRPTGSVVSWTTADGEAKRVHRIMGVGRRGRSLQCTIPCYKLQYRRARLWRRSSTDYWICYKIATGYRMLGIHMHGHCQKTKSGVMSRCVILVSACRKNSVVYRNTPQHAAYVKTLSCVRLFTQ